MPKTLSTVFVPLLCLILSLTSCDANTPEAANPDGRIETVAAGAVNDAVVPLVTTTTASNARLPLRRQANGKLRARRQVKVKSQTAGTLLKAPNEGRYYQAGALLIATDPRPLELARDQARVARDEAAYRQRDLLLRISTHLSGTDSSQITDLARENILIQSGLPAAEIVLRQAEYNLSLAQQTASFGGRAADVVVQVGSLIAAGEEVCTLVDLGSLEAEFSLLEQEIAGLGERRAVFITPVSRPKMKLPADLDIINPSVDDGGLLRVRARLRGRIPDGLYPGMNVMVTLEGKAPEAIVLPKSAIVERSGRTLVFTHDEDTGRAKWQYVTVGYENDERVAVLEGVEIGQSVIVTGNLTLDHDAAVRLE